MPTNSLCPKYRKASAETLSRQAGPLTTYPRSERVFLGYNVIDSVHNWTCFDAHGGALLTYVGNVARNCQVGIRLGIGGASGQGNAPFGVLVLDNFIDRTKPDGGDILNGPDLREMGIAFTGGATEQARDASSEMKKAR